MEVVQEADIIEWLRDMGFKAEGAYLSKTAVSKLLKGGGAKTWSQIIRTWKPADSKLASDQTPSVKPQQRAKELQQELQAQLEANKRLEELVSAQQAHLEARLHEVLLEEARQAQAAQQAQGIQYQLHVVNAYIQRLSQLVPTIQQYAERLQQFVALARSRAATARAGPVVDPRYTEAFDTACAQLKAQLQTQAGSWLAGHAGGDLPLPSPHLPGSTQRILGAPTLGITDQTLAALDVAPSVTMGHMLKVLERQVSQLQALLDKGPSMEGLLPATGGLEAVPDPMAMLRQRQQAHWDKTIQIEDTLTRAAEAQAAYDALRPAAQPVLAWPYNHLRLAEARLTAELGVLQAHMARLDSEKRSCQEADEALKELWHSNQEAGRMEQQLNRLVLMLITETSEITQRWAAESAQQKIWAQRGFPQACQTLLASAASCHQLATGEAEAAAAVPQAALVPRASGVSSASTAEALQQQQHLNSGSGAGHGHPHNVPAVLRYQRALPAAASSGLASADHRGGDDVSASVVVTSSSRGGLHSHMLGSPGPVGSGGSAPAALGSSPGLRGRGAAAGGGNGTPGKWRQHLVAAPKAGPEARLGAVLRAACLLDPLAPLRCPARLVVTVHGAVDEARRLQSWGSAALAGAEAAHKRQGELDVVLRLRQSQVATLRTETAAARLSKVQSHAAQTQGMLQYIAKTIRQHLEDFRTLPAVNLLPDVSYGGMCAAEWLTAIQDLHAQLREAEARHKAPQH